MFCRIPKDATVRSKWIEFCGLNEKFDDISKVLICSKHFASNDYLEPKAKELDNYLKLKSSAIPSNVPGQEVQPSSSLICNLPDDKSDFNISPDSGWYLLYFKFHNGIIF